MTNWDNENYYSQDEDEQREAVGVPLDEQVKQLAMAREPRYFDEDLFSNMTPLSAQLNAHGCKSPRSHKVDGGTGKVICDGVAQRLCYFYRLVQKSNLGSSQDSCPAGISDSTFEEIGEIIG